MKEILFFFDPIVLDRKKEVHFLPHHDEIQKVYLFVVTLKINKIYQWRSMCSMFEWLSG